MFFKSSFSLALGYVLKSRSILRSSFICTTRPSILPLRTLVSSRSSLAKKSPDQSLSDFFDLTSTENIKDTAAENVPQGHSSTFYTKYSEISTALADGKYNGYTLFDLGKTVETVDDLKLFGEFLKEWNTSQKIQIDPHEAKSLVKLFVKRGGMLYPMILDLLADKRKYGLLARKSDYDTIFSHFYTSSKNSFSLETLDLMFKTFGLMIYYDVEPAVSHYEMLIDASLAAPQEHHWRAVYTYKEAKSFGWSLSKELESKVVEAEKSAPPPPKIERRQEASA